MNVIFENEQVMIVDKPAGWLSVPARLKEDARPCLGRELQQRAGGPIFPVHRLDFEVSGLTLWAKTAESHRVAQEWFEHSTVRKVYQALSRRGSELPEMEWVSKLVRGKKRAFVAPHGKLSRTLARPLGKTNDVWRWELIAITGRPHQLRFEMAQHGFPILGDVLYGGEALREPNKIALRAVELDFSALAEAERLGLPEKCSASHLGWDALTGQLITN